MNEVRGKKIFIGLSGGVDSAASAALLQRAGAQIHGVFIKGWYPPDMPCTWAEDRRDAMRVAARLRIPFETLDASVEYKQYVIDYLLAEYKAGRTPNPDVMCNREIKFGVFYNYAMSKGSDFIATGHYRSGEKDQSYFLWAVPKEVLAKTVFPVGYMNKSEVRELARKFNLPVSEKQDSQGICFLGSMSVKDFLERELGDNPAILRTLGERVNGKYVVAKDLQASSITLEDVPTSHTVREIAFVSQNFVGDAQNVAWAQTRYRGPIVTGHIAAGKFLPSEPTKEFATPGQSIVFYDTNQQLIGGGIIS